MQKRECRRRFPDDKSFEKGCAGCIKKDVGLDEYFIRLYDLLKLQKAGYPFGKNDLSLETWEELGMLKEAITEKQIEEMKIKK